MKNQIFFTLATILVIASNAKAAQDASGAVIHQGDVARGVMNSTWGNALLVVISVNGNSVEVVDTETLGTELRYGQSSHIVFQANKLKIVAQVLK